ncbi:M3K4 kinase, partial [Polypterus senegalus]
MSVSNRTPQKENGKPGEIPEEHSYKQGKKHRSNIRSTERDHKKTFEGSFMLDTVTGSLPKNMDPRKPYLSLGCVSTKHPHSMPVPLARTTRQTSRTDCPIDRLKFFETLRLLLRLTSVSSKKKEKEQIENTSFMGMNNEVIWLELQAWHARRSIGDQDVFLYTARQAIPEIINEVLHFKVDYRSLNNQKEYGSCDDILGEDDENNDHEKVSQISPMRPTSYHEHLQRQRLSFEQVKRVMELLESVEALYPSLLTLQRDYEKYAAKDFQSRVQALCLWLNITKDLNQKLRIMGTVLGIKNLSDIGWPVFEIPSPRPSKGNEEEEDEENDSTATYTEGSEEEELIEDMEGEITPNNDEYNHKAPRLERVISEDDITSSGAQDLVAEAGFSKYCSTSIYRPFVDKALKQMGLRKLILRLHKLMDGSLQRARSALIHNDQQQELSDFPDPMLCSDYLPELTKHLSTKLPSSEENSNSVAWDELLAMDLPSFEPAFLVLCRVLLNVIHECLKLRLEQRPAGEPSLLSIKQLVIECKEVLKGGLLMKQYYQFMLRGVINELQGLQKNSNIDEFEEDLHKMLMVYFDYMRSWIQMLQHLPQASHSLKNVLEEEWNFTKVITPYVRGGEAQSGKLFWRSVIETSRSLKQLFHEVRERASKALGFAKMLRKDLEIAADFTVTVGISDLLLALRTKQYTKVQIPGLEDLLVFIPASLSPQRSVVLHLLNAAAGKDCSKDSDDINDVAYLLMIKQQSKDCNTTAQWEGSFLKLVPQVETVDALRSMQVDNLLLIIMHSAHLVTQRKVFLQSMEGLISLHREQTSSQPVIAKVLDQLKNEALQLCNKIANAISQVEYLFTSQFENEVEDSEPATLQQYYREAMIQSYNFGFEYHKEVVRLMSGEFRKKIGDKYISFARKWMNYVLTKCESGRGTRPRWATQGFDFLQSIEPSFISALNEDDFLTLMNECIGHVIGKPHSPIAGLYLAPTHRTSPRPVKVPRCHSDPPNPHLIIPNPEGFRGTNAPENDRLSSVAAELQFKSLSRHSSPTEDREDVAAKQSPMEAVRRAIKQFEEERYRLMKQKNIIGQVCSTPSCDTVMHVGLRKVTFKWQRGNKIGEGQYGKVYTCINVDTGELMAMKEIRFQPNDHKTIKETADELKIFEGIKHPNLVRYFGVELHREEMYIFMEFCDEGTLEEVSRLGLQEHVIRLYTKQITTAINVLHDHGIVHRDIKGANIFLTSCGLIKLGDFGCSVKLKNNAQTMPGEVNSTLGTAAYMAPEVITRAKGEGHGRAADIWSLGCVLIEMVTGKRPWHEYEHNFQIMYKVGMGHKPPVPEKLSTEGKDFLTHCLESEPKRRWTASQLLDHPFVKVR